MIGPYPRRPHRRRRPACRGQPNVFYVGAQRRRRLEDAPTSAAPGRRSSTTSPPVRSARSPSRHRIPTSSTSAAARDCSAPTSRSATASTSPTDAGKTWTHLGLRDGQQIRAIIVDPRDANRVFVAVLGHPYGPTRARRVSLHRRRATFEKVLLQGREHRRHRPRVRSREPASHLRGAVGRAPGPVGERRLVSGPGQRTVQIHRRRRHLATAHHRAADAGQGLGRIGIAVAPSDPTRLRHGASAATLGGVYRSDDAGETLDAREQRGARLGPRR